MRTIVALSVILLTFSTSSFGKEPYVSLTNYVDDSEAICICTVEKDNADGTVTVQVDQGLKGQLDKTEVLRGDTGHCVLSGPVSTFMKPKNRYLVFLFRDNTVGRLGGILPIQKNTLLARFIDGFTKTEFDKKERTDKLPLKKAIEQIESILKKKEKAQALDSK